MIWVNGVISLPAPKKSSNCRPHWPLFSPGSIVSTRAYSPVKPTVSRVCRPFESATRVRIPAGAILYGFESCTSPDPLDERQVLRYRFVVLGVARAIHSGFGAQQGSESKMW